MTFAVKVNGGTGAGRKKGLLPANTIPWACACEVSPALVRFGNVKVNPGYLKRCVDCKTERPV